MTAKPDLRYQRQRAFREALAELRLKLAPVVSILIWLALARNGRRLDYLIAAGYSGLSLLFLIGPRLNRWGRQLLYLPLLIIDLAVLGWMLVGSGGPNSLLLPLLFLPVAAAAVRFRLTGVLLWSSLMALLLVASAAVDPQLDLTSLLFKIILLYLVGVAASFLIHRTYLPSEQTSHQLAHWNRELQRLNNYMKEVSGSSDWKEICSQTLKIIEQNYPAAVAAIMFFDEARALQIQASSGWEETWLVQYQRHPLDANSLTLAPILVFKQPLLLADITKHPDLVKALAPIPAAAFFAFPLVMEKDVVGAIVLIEAISRQLSEPEVQIMTSIANQAGSALQNLLSFHQEKRRANTDGLTGLFNRRYFNEQLTRLAGEAERFERPLSLMLLDIDNFKLYNDTYGHPAGDRVLERVAAVLREVVRESDIVARYGGEEFAVILQQTEHQVARQIAERIRDQIENLPPGTLQRPITISIGVATMPDHASDWTTLLECTDKSLYQAKHSGKNQVCCARQIAGVG